MSMKLHHIGILCQDIAQEIEQLRKIHQVHHVSPIVHDEIQNADVCMLTIEDNVDIELISGEKVSGMYDKGIRYAHICYEVDDIEAQLADLKSKGVVIVSPPQPAKLFDMRRVAFVYMSYGLIEFVESAHE